MRDNERNRPNLRRLAAYYEREGVPFDPQRGFDPGRVVREAPRWAFEHGLVPAGFERLEAAARSLDPRRRTAARQRLAELSALLGLYERAVDMDRWLLRANPHSLAAARRLVWSLLHLGRGAEAQQAALQLAALPETADGISEWLLDASRRVASLAADAGAQAGEERVEEEAEQTAALLAGLPIFTSSQARQALAGIREPDARLPRR